MQLVEPSVDGCRVSWKQAAVECDGHEFHDKTREQAIRDRERDRFLNSNGLTILHYAGAEIRADVFKCAEEVLKHLRSGIIEQRSTELGLAPKKPPVSVVGSNCK